MWTCSKVTLYGRSSEVDVTVIQTLRTIPSLIKGLISCIWLHAKLPESAHNQYIWSVETQNVDCSFSIQSWGRKHKCLRAISAPCSMLGPVLWQWGLSFCLQCQYLILENQINFCLLCLWSSFLLVDPRRQHKVFQGHGLGHPRGRPEFMASGFWLAKTCLLWPFGNELVDEEFSLLWHHSLLYNSSFQINNFWKLKANTRNILLW